MAFFNQLILVALAACIGRAAADKDNFPLVWLCLGLTIAGIIIAGYAVYRRPETLSLPGSTVMTAQESDRHAYDEPSVNQKEPLQY